MTYIRILSINNGRTEKFYEYNFLPFYISKEDDKVYYTTISFSTISKLAIKISRNEFLTCTGLEQEELNTIESLLESGETSNHIIAKAIYDNVLQREYNKTKIMI